MKDKYSHIQITFIVTSPQHKCLCELNSYERAPDSAKNNNLHMYTLMCTVAVAVPKSSCSYSCFSAVTANMVNTA